MRAVVVICVLLILSSSFQPASAVTFGRPPALVLALSPASMSIISRSTDTISVNFSGTATVETGRLDRSTYKLGLQSTLDIGWASVVSPADLTFTGSGSQEFACTVEIPPAVDNITATLTVDGSLRGGGFVVTSSASSLLLVDNLTANLTLARHITPTSGPDAVAGTGLYIATAITVTVCIVILSGVIIIRWRRSRQSIYRGPAQ